MSFLLALAGAAVIAAAALGIYWSAEEGGKPQFPGMPHGIPASGAPQALEDVNFQDAEGKPVALSDFRGKVVLLNLWATWCVPCREEMPALDRLQQKLGGPGFEVVALSIDRAGRERWRKVGPAEWDSPAVVEALRGQFLVITKEIGDGKHNP